MAGMHAYLSFTVNFWSSLYIFGNRNILLIKGPYRGTIINSKMSEHLFNVLAVNQGCASRLDNLMCLPCCVWFYVGVDLCSLVYKLSIYWLHCLKGGCGSSSQLASSHTRKTGISRVYCLNFTRKKTGLFFFLNNIKTPEQKIKFSNKFFIVYFCPIQISELVSIDIESFN